MTAKLTDDQYREIEASTEKGSVLAKRYGITPVWVWMIRRRAGRPGKKLTNKQVLDIFMTEGPSRLVGKMYGVSHQTVRNIKTGAHHAAVTERARAERDGI